MNADGTNVQTLVAPVETETLDQDLNNATYSVDGKRIFYQRWTPESIQLWVMNADGTDPHEFKPEPGQGWDGLPSPSPDGRWLAYWHVIEDGRTIQHVSVVRADGNGPIMATGPDLTGLANWVWSPDSTKILDVLGRLRQQLGVPARSRGWPVHDGPLAIRRGPRLAAPRAMTSRDQASGRPNATPASS